MTNLWPILQNWLLYQGEQRREKEIALELDNNEQFVFQTDCTKYKFCISNWFEKQIFQNL